MSTNLATAGESQQITRPLHVLVPLIHADLKQAREAEERAGLPYYTAAGQKMVEAKGQLKHGEFGPWVKHNFGLSLTQSSRYMALAIATNGTQNLSARYESLSDFVRDTGREPRGTARGGAGWHDPVKQTLDKVDTDTLNRRAAELKRVEERDAQRQLALQLIDIGYKALATKLHPDKGGSRDAMSRLNQVRDRLKAHA